MLTTHNIFFRYPKSKKNLYDNLSLSFYPGEIYGLMGQNGEGKSTLLKLLCGLLTPQKGHVSWNNIPVKGRKFLQNLFFLPEETDLPHLNLKKYTSLLAPLYPNFSYQFFKQVCEQFCLETEQSMRLMSLGQKKKSLIAFGLATRVPLIILDEPTNGLDIFSKNVLRSLLATMKSPNQTIIISTHQARDIQEITTGLMILQNNQIVFNYTVEFLKKHIVITDQKATEHTLFTSSQGDIYHNISIKTESNTNNLLDLELLYLAATDKERKLQTYLSEQTK